MSNGMRGLLRACSRCLRNKGLTSRGVSHTSATPRTDSRTRAAGPALYERPKDAPDR